MAEVGIKKKRAARRKPKLAVEEFPSGSGIKIRQRINCSTKSNNATISYRVTLPTKITGKPAPVVRQKKTELDAKKWAKEQFELYRDQGKLAEDLNLLQRMQAAEVFGLLEETGVRLDEAVRQYIQITRAVEPTGKSIDQVVSFALERLNPEGGERTFAEVAEEIYTMKLQSGLRERTVRDFRHRTAKLAGYFGDTPIKEITTESIRFWFTNIDLAPRTRKNYLMVAGEVFKFSLSKRYIAENPLHGLTPQEKKAILGSPEDSRREPNILTVEEAKRLIEAARDNLDLGLLPAVTLGLFCGIRTEEIKRLVWEDVHLDEKEPFVNIGPHIAKKRRIRNVELSPNAIAWLSLDQRITGPITKNTYVSDHQKRFRKLQRLAGFGESRTLQTKNGKEKEIWRSTWDENNMRHSFATYHYALYGDPLLTARLLGHRATDDVLFDHYRSLATMNQAKGYFALFGQIQ